LYRPPRAVHCRVCDNCVERYDHHCTLIPTSLCSSSVCRSYQPCGHTRSMVLISSLAHFEAMPFRIDTITANHHPLNGRVGNCVGKRNYRFVHAPTFFPYSENKSNNYRYFYMFVNTATFALFYVTCMTALQMTLTFFRSSESEFFPRVLDTFLTYPTPPSYLVLLATHCCRSLLRTSLFTVPSFAFAVALHSYL